MTGAKNGIGHDVRHGEAFYIKVCLQTQRYPCPDTGRVMVGRYLVIVRNDCYKIEENILHLARGLKLKIKGVLKWHGRQVGDNL